MIHRTFIIAVLILAVAGCGAGNGDSNEGVPANAETASSETVPTTDANATAGTEAAVDAGTAAAKTAPTVDTSKLDAAPAWELVDLAGNAVTGADFEGKVVLLDFWATWCGPCRKSIPDLVGLYRDYKDQGLEIVGVSLDQKGPSVVKPFVEQFKIDYPIVMGNQQIVQAFGGIRGIPAAFVITPDGKIYRKYVGLRPRSVFEKDIKDLLGLTS